MTQLRASAIFLSFNQRAFVEEALRSVLAQTVPIEIVIADDGSVDGTWERILEVLAEGHGRHSVLLLPRMPNAGIARNISRACASASGEWQFLFEGDDRSEPNRVQHMLHTIDGARGSLIAVSSSRTIDAAGKLIELDSLPSTTQTAEAWHAGRWPPAKGCVMAWHASVFQKLGRIDRRVVACDGVLTLRGVALGGGVVSSSQLLVDYRRHSANVSGLFRLRFGNRRELASDLGKLRKNELGALAECLKLRSVAHAANRQQISALIDLQRAKARLCIAADGGTWALMRAALRNFREGHAVALSLRCLLTAVSPASFNVLRAVRRMLRSRSSA